MNKQEVEVREMQRRTTPTPHRHDPEIRECHNDDCERQYDLARQDYYAGECPTCHEGGDDA